jgi:precorrin-3B synthase
VVIDGGGALHLKALKADIGVTATSVDRWLVSLAGLPAGEAAAGQVASAVLALLQRLVAAGRTARMANLVAAHGVAALAREAGLSPAHPTAARPEAEPVGLIALRDGSVALGLGLAFGQVRAEALDGLVEAARAAGARHVEPAAGRALLVVGLSRETAADLRAQAATLGFLTDPADPRRRIFACAGRPACGSARIDTHALAEIISSSLRGGQVHISGCAKGCAHPAKAALTIVGLDEGAGLVVEGTARDVPLRIVPEARLAGAAREFLQKGEI